MTSQTIATDPNKEFVVVVADLFAGAGGYSTGAEKAIEEIGGKIELYAVNHWPVAVETHQRNHPNARHYLQDLNHSDPEKIVPEGQLDLLLASPECRFFSRARGGKPVHDQGRMNPWIIQRWLTSLRVKCLLVENVPEFISWGPLLENGRPDKAKKSLYFEEWVKSLWGIGYAVEWRMLNAANYGDATTRTRFFLQARNDGRPIRWPKASHAKAPEPGLLSQLPRWRAARDIIDWTNPGRSLLDDPKYRKKPLSEKTRRRIARGLERYGGPLAHLYIQLLNLPDLPVGTNPNPADRPVQAEQPFILNRSGENGFVRAHSIENPIPTATARGAGYLVETEAKHLQNQAPGTDDAPPTEPEPFVGANRTGNVPKSIEEPIPPATTAPGGGSYLVKPAMTPFTLSQQSGGAPRTADQPLPTITKGGTISLVRPSIIEYYGQSHARATTDPLSTVTSNRKHALIQPTVTKHTIPDQHGPPRADEAEDPQPTKATKHQNSLANPTLVEVNHGNFPNDLSADDRRAHSIDQPLGVVTSVRNIGLAQPMLAQASQTGGNGSSSDADRQPARTEAILQQAQEEGIDPRRLVFIDDQPFILDIRFRMLQNTELARAMGFQDEETDYEFVGNAGEITKQIGNAVPVNLAQALVRAALDPATPE